MCVRAMCVCVREREGSMRRWPLCHIDTPTRRRYSDEGIMSRRSGSETKIPSRRRPPKAKALTNKEPDVDDGKTLTVAKLRVETAAIWIWNQ